jgi:hypothetical protein
MMRREKAQKNSNSHRHKDSMMEEGGGWVKTPPPNPLNETPMPSAILTLN